MQENPLARRIQEQFGKQAHLYAESDAHRAGEGLASITEYVSMDMYGNAVDIGTGAGFTAFAMAPYSRHVLATDIAPGMLAQARRLAAERNLGNVGFMAAEAENLPFSTEFVDAVSCRQAAHHFHDLPRAISEIWRVLKPGAPFILSDPVAPESQYEALWMNDVELRRDAVHQRDLKVSEWRDILGRVGFYITHWSIAKVYLEFNDWVLRAATPKSEVGRLRHDFASAPASVVAAFGIKANGEAIDFHWDVVVLKAVKR